MKRILSAILALTLAALILCGCAETEGLTRPAETLPEEEGVEAVPVYAEKNGASIRIMLPADWEYAPVPETVAAPAFTFYPKAAPEGSIRVQYSEEFGFCAEDDMETKSVVVNGKAARATTFDGASFWKFIVLDSALGGNYVVMSFVDEAWWSEYGEEVTGILETLTVGQPFSFALTWNVYGISSYDSATGRLVKTNDATRPEDYVTELRFSSEELGEILREIAILGPENFPDEYDPYNAPDAETKTMTSPDRTLILTVREGDREKTVACRNICLTGDTGYDFSATYFLSFCKRLSERIEATDEWKALPDYEFLYD